MTKEKTLARLAESRRALHQAIEGLSEEEMTQVKVEGVWTIKDVLGHIASWEETCLEPLRLRSGQALQRYADGGPFEVQVIEDYLSWNDEQAARLCRNSGANETSRWMLFWTNWPPSAPLFRVPSTRKPS